MIAHVETGRIALDLRPGDIYWCTADPGWVTGTSHGIIAPLTNRVTMVVDEAEFDLERWYGILEREGEVVRELPPGRIGELALRPGWPSMMRAYLHEEARDAKCFAGGWYLTGDLALRDADGCFRFVGRADDLIKSSGHLIGPFEIESALIAHPAVAEAAVIGLPDETAGEIVKAFVALKPGFAPSETLEREIRGHARRRLGPAVTPREIVFRDSLPRTRSGKIMRRLLKARELGLPEGDLSTLEIGPR